MSDIIRIMDEETEAQQSWSMEKIKEYVKIFMQYEDQIKTLRESRTDWSKDFIANNNLPKKELSQAMAIVKKDLDAEVITEIIENIENMM